jgi:hypothetical protein
VRIDCIIPDYNKIFWLVWSFKYIRSLDNVFVNTFADSWRFRIFLAKRLKGEINEIHSISR